MKSLRVPLTAIAVSALVTACVHPQARPAPAPTPMPPVATATPPTVTITPEPPILEITPAPQVIVVPPSQPTRPPTVRHAPVRHVRQYGAGRIYGTTYRVRRGDDLWEIARRAYGNPLRWPHVYRVNRSHIRNPRLIYPGQVIHLPRRR